MLWDMELLEQEYPDECREIRQDERKKVMREILDALSDIAKGKNTGDKNE